MGGIYFQHFIQLFRGYTLDDQGTKITCDKIPVRCAGITDCDPQKESRPTTSNPCGCGNPQHFLVKELQDHPNCRLYCNLKTFEYDLAMEGNNLQLMSKVYLKTISTDGPNRRQATDMAQTDWTNSSEQNKSDAAYWLLQHVSSNKGEFAQLLAQELSQCDTVDFSVPSYIRQAILWAIGLNQREQAREEETPVTL